MQDSTRLDARIFRDFFSADKYAVMTGIEIDAVSIDCVECSMAITPGHLNANGVVQGGAIFTLADLAFAAHCNIGHICGEDVGVSVGQSCYVTFLKPAKGKRLAAKTSCLSQGRTMSVFRVTVEDDNGVVVAEFIGNAFRMSNNNNAK